MSDGNRFLKGFFSAGVDISRAKMDAQAKQDEIRAQGAEAWKRTVYETEAKRQEAEEERKTRLEVAKIMAGKKASDNENALAALRMGFQNPDRPTQSNLTAPEAPEQAYAPQTGEPTDATNELTNEVAAATGSPSTESFTPAELPSSPESPQATVRGNSVVRKAKTAGDNYGVEGAIETKGRIHQSLTSINAEKHAPLAAEEEVKLAEHTEKRADRTEDKLNELTKYAGNDYDSQAYDSTDKEKKQVWRNPFYPAGEDGTDEAKSVYTKNARIAREIIKQAYSNTDATQEDITRDTQELIKLLNYSALPDEKKDPTRAQELQDEIDLLATNLGLSPDEVEKYKSRLVKDKTRESLTITKPSTETVGRITVISPDGVPGTIPANQLDAALKAGYKQK